MIEHLRVRMYRMGFGDCFLLSLRVDGGERHILVDCGSITEGKAHVGAVVKDVIEACTPAGGGPPRLELVVATHRHRDHVGGFKDAAWDGVEVGEVWMPWTEDPDDPAARKILNSQSGFAAALAGALSPGFDPDAEPLAGQSKPSLKASRLGMALNALTNEQAMATLHRGFAGRPPRHFLPIRDTVCEARSLANVPGLRIHVLGPPRSEAAMSDMSPPKGEAYLARRAAAAAAGGGAVDPAAQPQGAFRAWWRVPEAESAAPRATFNAEDQRKVRDAAEDPDGDLAAAIDRAVNNTSLVLMFEVGDQWLLFPGDAQWGTWNAALQDPASRRLLERTTVYKIGHHGSENATPRVLIDSVIAQPYAAFLSMRDMAQWKNIPRGPLIAAMKEKGATLLESQKAVPDLCIEWNMDLSA